MEYALIIILLALLQYVFFTLRAGLNREKYDVLVPKTTGNETWERLYRVQQNTLEQLVIFIPAMWIFSQVVSPLWATLPGVLFLIGRQMYSHAYINTPEKRGAGMMLGFLSYMALVLGALIGIVIKMLF